MGYYRLYFLDSDDRILHGVMIDGETDMEAEEAARRYIGDQTVELWDKDRRLIRFESVAKASELHSKGQVIRRGTAWQQTARVRS